MKLRISCLILIAFSISLYAQDSLKTKSPKIIMDAGFGFYSSDNHGLVFPFGVGVRSNIHSLTLRANVYREIFSDSEFPKMTATEFGLMYGLCTSRKNIFVSGSAGFGFMTGTDRGQFIKTTGSWFTTRHEYTKETYNVFTFPLSLEFYLKFDNTSAIGVFLAASLNNHENMYSGGLKFAIGKGLK